MRNTDMSEKSPFKKRRAMKIKLAVKDYYAGLPLSAICEKYDIEQSAIFTYRKANNLPPRERGSRKDMPKSKRRRCLGCREVFEAKLQSDGFYAEYCKANCAGRATWYLGGSKRP